MKKTKYNNMGLGLIIGIAAPLMTALVFYLASYSDIKLGTFVSRLWQINILMPIISLCAVVNLGIFFLFMRKDKYASARGIILATLIYAVMVLINKFI